ncbi:MAG: SDR family oxidoreductase [Nitriliruptoraceae bacterium]
MTGRIRRALVTGASAGIGERFAHHLADRGVELVLVARRRDRLEALAATLPVAVEVVTADLADAEDLATVCARAGDRDRPVDLVINNAGVGAYGPVAEQDEATLTRLVDVNVTAVVQVTRAALPQLLERDLGGIINVGSTAGYRPGPFSAAYGGSKAFVRSFTEAVYEEVRNRGVHVLLLSPGFTATEFQVAAGADEDAVPARLAGSADTVVHAALAAFAAGRAVCLPTPVDRVLAYGSELFPGPLPRRISGFLHRRLASR